MKGDQHRTEKTDWVGKSEIKCKKEKKSSKLPEGPAFPLTSLPSDKVQDPVGPEGQELFQRQQERRTMIKEHPGQGAGKGKNSDLEETWLKLKRKKKRLWGDKTFLQTKSCLFLESAPQQGPSI